VITKFPNRNDRSIAAFSLVEVVLALSIMGFVCVTLIGLMATGLSSIQKSNATSVQSQIIQEVINNTQGASYTTNYATNLYFDDEGTAVSTTGTTAGTGAIYTASVTSTVACIPTGTSTVYQFLPADSQLLQIKIKSKSNPSVTNTFTLVWPNTGN